MKINYENLVNLKTGGSQQNLNALTIKNFPIVIPPLLIQQHITNILSTYDDLIETNNQRIKLLEAVSQILLADFLKAVELPPCKIIKHDAASWRGMANCIPLKRPITVSPRMHIRYRLSQIALKRSLLFEGDFGAVLSTYLHEIAHMFGNEGSASFSKALTELLEITLSNTRIVELFREQWQKL